jgi:hypothetical protein
MKSLLFHSLIGACVAVAASSGASALILKYAPKGEARKACEKWIIAPGGVLFEKIQEVPRARSIHKALEKIVDRVEDAKDRIEESGVGSVLPRPGRLPHYYNAAAWGGAGFAACFLLALFFGVSSIKSALAMGFKVTLALFFLQGALVLAGVLAVRRAAGG